VSPSRVALLKRPPNGRKAAGGRTASVPSVKTGRILGVAPSEVKTALQRPKTRRDRESNHPNAMSIRRAARQPGGLIPHNAEIMKIRSMADR